jgi:hypothetical protein
MSRVGRGSSSSYIRASSPIIHRLLSSCLYRGRQVTISSATPISRVLFSSRTSSTTHDYRVFDRDLKREQRNRAANSPEFSREVDYLKDDVAASMIDRLLVISIRIYIYIYVAIVS